MTARVAAAGGRSFDTWSLLLPLLFRLLDEHGQPGLSAAFAHEVDQHHFAPAANKELNKALLTMLCDPALAK